MAVARGKSLFVSIFSLIFAFGIAAPTFAAPGGTEWSVAARRDFAALERRMEARPNGKLSGAWGSFGVEIGGRLRSKRFKHRFFKYDPEFQAEAPPIEYLVSRTGRSVSPLVIYFPGVFGDATSAGGLLAARMFRRARNHVVVLPNPWSRDFQAARPKFMPGQFDHEAAVMVEMIRDAIAFIGPERISELHFFGESYGGFLAPATAKAYNESGFGHVKSVTSVSVPYQIGNAIEVLDRLSDRQEANYFDKGCGVQAKNFFNLVGFVYQMIVNPNRDEIYTRDGTPCSAALFSYVAFEQPLYRMAKEVNERAHFPAWEAHPDSYWMRKARFQTIGPIFYDAPIESILGASSANLAYWVDSARGQGTSTLALIAKDDPLNPPPGVGSYEVIDAYEPAEILVLSKGGHLGFRGTKEYRRLLRDRYRDAQVAPEDANAPDYSLDNDPSAATDGYDDSADVDAAEELPF